jgi:hypothetical protein
MPHFAQKSSNGVSSLIDDSMVASAGSGYGIGWRSLPAQRQIRRLME